MTLPLLLSVPHAGTDVPAEVAAYCALTPEEIIADGDEGAAEIYALAEEVDCHVTTAIARAVVDLNRPPDDFGRDGVIKTHTCWEVPVWDPALPPGRAEELIHSYWRPYHERLRDLGTSGRFLLGVDGHTMAAYGPPVGPDAGAERPAACLSNADGTCPPAWIESLRDALARRLGREVTINQPFRGGYITRSHAAEMPWLQIEFSRAPFAGSADKRRAVLAALTELCEEIA